MIKHMRARGWLLSCIQFEVLNPVIGVLMATRRSSARWEGGLKGGKGTFKGESGAIGGQYSFSSRFEEGVGSNPEELLAAAEAACYSMALSGNLEKNGT